jgi:hypothetical protein
MRDIRESDWKILRRLHPIALDRYCQRVLDEVAQACADTAKTHHQRYGDVWRLLEQRDRDLANAFNMMSRSKAFLRIVAIHSLGLLTAEEFGEFSPEMRNSVESFLR